jgi:molybdate transport system substrate-binding protein
MAIMRVAASVRMLAMLAFVGRAGHAGAEEIRVDVTGAPSVAVKTIAADFSAQTGHGFKFTVAQPATLEGYISAGDRADVVILPSVLVAKLSKAGALRAETKIDLARVRIGIVVRAGAPQPDISTPAAIRKLLLDAHSIVYPNPHSGGGSAGRAIMHMIERMGIADVVKTKVTLESAIGGGVALVASGRAEIGLFNISEIVPIQGAALVGPLPEELQSYIVFTAAIPASNTAPDLAASFIKRLTDPAARPVWQKAGLEPLAAAQ